MDLIEVPYHGGWGQFFLLPGLYIYLFIEGLQPNQPHKVTSGFFTKSSLIEVEYNTKHAHLTNLKHNPKVRPFGIALIKMEEIHIARISRQLLKRYEQIQQHHWEKIHVAYINAVGKHISANTTVSWRGNYIWHVSIRTKRCRKQSTTYTMYLLKSFSPVNRTWSPQGFLLVQTLNKSNNKYK